MATAKLLINGNDAKETYGITMGDDFIDTLFAQADMKDYIENTSCLEHGKRVTITNSPKKTARTSLSLIFRIEGTSSEDFQAKKDAFFKVLYNAAVDISVPRRSSEVFHLLYKKASSYAQNPQGTFCKVAATFEEPNPNDRGETSNSIFIVSE